MINPGPQRGPASTARIDAQWKAVQRELYREMPKELYIQFDESGKIPSEWTENGWHFCLEMDGALVHQEDVSGFCQCFEGSEPLIVQSEPLAFAWDEFDNWVAEKQEGHVNLNDL